MVDYKLHYVYSVYWYNIVCFREIQIVSEVSFSDWIWDTCFLPEMNEEPGCTVAAITGHNAVWMWNFRANKKWKISQCEEQCILYPFNLNEMYTNSSMLYIFN